MVEDANPMPNIFKLFFFLLFIQLLYSCMFDGSMLIDIISSSLQLIKNCSSIPANLKQVDKSMHCPSGT